MSLTGRRAAVAALALATALTGCGATHRPLAATRPLPPAPAATPAPTTSVAPTTVAPPPPTTTGAPATTPAPAGPLAGKVVAVDPGHDGGNAANPEVIDAPIFNGRTSEACDTTGAETDGGYPEHLFNWNVAEDLAARLRAEGATVVLTRSTDTGVGPCVTQRAAIGNQAHADVALSIHADGGPAGGRGFAVLEPVADGPNDAVIGASQTFGADLVRSFAKGTGEPTSTYDGVGGVQARDDLGGTNLTTVPKVFLECANMRNAADAALLVTPAWQQQAAGAIAAGITAFLAG